MCSSDVCRSVVAVALALSLLALAPPPATATSREPASRSPAPIASARAVRPVVALRLAIDAGVYRRVLQDDACQAQCLVLQRALVDSVRSLLRSSYAFLDWRADGGAALDTVEIRWLDKPPAEVPGTRLVFRVASSAADMSTDAYPLDFEGFDEVNDRPIAAWRPDSLRRIWLARLRSRLATPDLVSAVFGRIPIGGRATFQPTGRVHVSAVARDLGLSERARPVFQVRALVSDPARGTEESATLRLEPCLRAAGGAGFVCDVAHLWYPGALVPRDSLAPLLRRATMRVTSLHLAEYAPDRAAPLGGAVLPPPVPAP